MFEFELLTKRDWAGVAVVMVAGSAVVGAWLYWLTSV
jgi:hypothetical protein